MKKKFILWGLFFVVVFIIFRAWFVSPVVTGGDLLYLYKEGYKNFTFLPLAWGWDQQNDFGGYQVPFLWYLTFGNVVISFFGKTLHIPYNIFLKFVYLFPYVIFSAIFPYILFKKIFQKKVWGILASGIFLCNTYMIMLSSGGQTLMQLAYALIPLLLTIVFILHHYIVEHKTKSSLVFSFIFGVLLALQLLLDLRIFYLTFFLFLTWFVIFGLESLRNTKYILNIILYVFLIPLGIVGLLHLFWILPILVTKISPLSELSSAYTSVASVSFFSFAKFENAMGLLHPNWPENIFGLTHFMRPEFFLLPILAFASLLFVKKTNDEKEQEQNGYILFFALLGLVGIFLSKGAQDPFGGIYLWLFNHVPGFVMFRDPTKWYMLIALSYAVLIPFTVSNVYTWLSKKQILPWKSKAVNVQNTFVFVFIVYLLFLIRPALLGQLGGTFQPHKLPQDYVTFEKYMVGEKNFSRVLWIPSLERFGFYSPTHPAVGSESLYNVTSVPSVLQKLSKKQTQTFLQQRGIGYIVVPYDVEGELFVKDRKYDNSEYLKTVAFLRQIPWLKEITGFGRIHVFEVANIKDHFWINDQGASIYYQSINPTKYLLTIKNAKKGDKVVFTDSFDSHWEMLIASHSIVSSPFENSLNSFVLPKGGTYTASIYYTPQKWIIIGVVVSLITLFGITGFLVYSFYSARQKQ